MTFIYNNATYTANDTFSSCYKEENGEKTRIKKADFLAAQAEYELEEALKKDTPETHDDPTPETPAEPKVKTHPTADTFRASIPEGFIFKVNAKGHIRVFKSEDDKDGGCYCKLNPLKDGVWVLPRKDLKAARPDIAWEEKPGWSSPFAYKAKDWAEAQEIIFGEPAQA